MASFVIHIRDKCILVYFFSFLFVFIYLTSILLLEYGVLSFGYEVLSSLLLEQLLKLCNYDVQLFVYCAMVICITVMSKIPIT